MNAPGPMLEILTGDLTGRRYRVEDAEFVIGRAPNCDLVLPKRYISREHARISRDGPEYVIDGLSELNPVLLGDRPASPRQRLTDGDVFELCKIRFRFVAVGDPPPPMKKAKAKKSGQHRFDDEDEAPDEAPDERDRTGTDPVGDFKATARFGDGSSSRSGDEPAAAQSAKSTKSSARHTKGSDPGGLRFEAEPATKKSGAKPKSGSRPDESAESQNERTAELGKVKDPNDPDYDPFAEVDTRKKKKDTRDPARDRALKLLMIVGALGIVLAGFIINELMKKKPIEYVDVGQAIRVKLNETIRFEEAWSRVDPPKGRTGSRKDGEPYVYHRDNVVEVEWAVPHMETKCVFLVRGVELGETQFELTFPVSNRIKRFTVIVEGDDPHEAAREARKNELRSKSPRELQQLALKHLGSGDTYTKEREVASREGNFRLALLEYAHAADAAVALRDLVAKEGTVANEVTELVRRAEEAESKASVDYEDFVAKTLAVYRAALPREPKAECIDLLKRSLRAINRDCDPRFRRLCLILEEIWGETWNADGSESCGEH